MPFLIILGAGSGSESDKSDDSDPEPEATAFAKSMGLIDAAAGTSSRPPPMPSAASSLLSGRELVSNFIHDLNIGAVPSPPVLGRFFCPQVLLPFFEDLKTLETLHVMKPPKCLPGFKAPVFCLAVLLPFLGDKVEKNQ